MVTLLGCEQNSEALMEPDSPQINSQAVGLANPFLDCRTLAEANTLSGVKLECPQSLMGYTEVIYRAMPQRLTEVIYTNAAGAQLCIRKSADSAEVSGDYNHYAEEQQVKVGSRLVKLKGRQGRVFLATFTEQGHAFSVGLYNQESGMSVADMSKLIAAIN
ncbi:MAG: hypothetical protein K6F05_06900 [Succinivibrio sp.]|nr:hypothetical protein [Succinivibrio sp.]